MILGNTSIERWCRIALLGLTLCSCTTKAPERLRMLGGEATKPASGAALNQGIKYSHFSANPHVKNGSAYERADFALPAHLESVTLPANWGVEEIEGTTVTILIHKNMVWMGHGDASIAYDRRKMGCVYKSKGRSLTFALYGAWSSFEGGTSIDAVIRVPRGVQVEKRRSLALLDHESLARFEKRGWQHMPEAPDPAWTFRKYADALPVFELSPRERRIRTRAD